MEGVHLPARQQLDTVIACEDLRGQFPPNVELKFVLWEHGTYDKDWQKSGDPVDALTPHLLEADIIALEVAAVDSPEAGAVERLEAQLRALNEFARGERSGSTLDEILGGQRPFTLIEEAAKILNNLNRAGKTSPPQFVAIDAYRDPVVAPDSSEDESFGQFALADAQYHARREIITVRQLQPLAEQLGRDGQPHQIAPVCGLGHTLLPVATQELGAPTSRVFVSRHPERPFSSLRRIVRFQPDRADQLREVDVFDSAIDEAIAEELLFRQLGVLPPDSEAPTAWLRYRAAKQTLTPRDRHRFDKQNARIRPYLDLEARKPGALARPFVRKAARRMLELADEV